MNSWGKYLTVSLGVMMSYRRHADAVTDARVGRGAEDVLVEVRQMLSGDDVADVVPSGKEHENDQGAREDVHEFVLINE